MPGGVESQEGGSACGEAMRVVSSTAATAARESRARGGESEATARER